MSDGYFLGGSSRKEESLLLVLIGVVSCFYWKLIFDNGERIWDFLEKMTLLLLGILILHESLSVERGFGIEIYKLFLF